MSTKTNNVVNLSDQLEVKKIQSLYKEYDACPLGSNSNTVYSNTGLSILDDVKFFLKHPKFREDFEQALLIHLKDFANDSLKNQ